LLANMRNGGAGTISATANVNPAAIDELYQSAKCQISNAKPQENSKLQTSKMTLPSREATALQEALQARLNVVREVFSNRKFSSMIAALKQAIAFYTNDPVWARVRPPLVELTTGQAKLLAAELKRISLSDGWNQETLNQELREDRIKK
jgi:4-hydroxy-tetrahydrodipicolinate synthase